MHEFKMWIGVFNLHFQVFNYSVCLTTNDIKAEMLESSMSFLSYFLRGALSCFAMLLSYNSETDIHLLFEIYFSNIGWTMLDQGENRAK